MNTKDSYQKNNVTPDFRRFLASECRQRLGHADEGRYPEACMSMVAGDSTCDAINTCVCTTHWPVFASFVVNIGDAMHIEITGFTLLLLSMTGLMAFLLLILLIDVLYIFLKVINYNLINK